MAEYATMAAAGAIPSRFEIGCLVPMQFDITIGAGGTATVDQRPRQDALPVALFADLSGADIVIDTIVGPDGDPAGMKGDGIGPTWRPGFFSYEALRSCVNPYPRDVGIATSSKGVEYNLTNTGIAPEDFVGMTFAFVAGTDGISYMQKCGMIGSQEAANMAKICHWIESGQPPNDLCELGRKMIGGHVGTPNGKVIQVEGRKLAGMTDGSYVPVP